ncbi:c-type cytochrome [Microvirga guangxiensis]|uniref:Cytochrome c553 n=1 Tax=Microvirga guangxiensis TaxID=549386 RepID=A0A1G5BRP5_9HYPH|nr:cytochrome c [Microvirga guangxiensis]SCX92862.1 Cytochrome c553 [Microvirga guangxiensis]
MKRLVLFGIALALGSSAAIAQSGRVQRGLTFAQTNCSQCHAIGRFGDSPIPEAPPFRTLSSRYPIEDLAEAFAEGITTGHPSMPQFELDPAQINDLLAYLNSIQG